MITLNYFFFFLLCITNLKALAPAQTLKLTPVEGYLSRSRRDGRPHIVDTTDMDVGNITVTGNTISPIKFKTHKNHCGLRIFWEHSDSISPLGAPNPRLFGYESYALTNCAITARAYIDRLCDEVYGFAADTSYNVRIYDVINRNVCRSIWTHVYTSQPEESFHCPHFSGLILFLVTVCNSMSDPFVATVKTHKYACMSYECWPVPWHTAFVDTINIIVHISNI